MSTFEDAGVKEALTVTLEWKGPFMDTKEFPERPGLYAVTGRMYGGSIMQLLYVGIATVSLCGRWSNCGKHRNWLARSVKTLQAEIRYAECDPQLVDDLETTLIFVHQPNQNIQKINSDLPSRRLIIHNTGSIPHGMLPVVDTAYPWFLYGVPT